MGAKGVGSYVKQHGFGYEDWNFNVALAANGKMLGYTVARPAARLDGEEFGLILATYGAHGWDAVGYYNGAVFNQQSARLPDMALRQMAVDLFELAETSAVSGEYAGKTLSEIESALRTESASHCWTVAPDRLVVLKTPVKIPKRLFNPGRQRMVTSYDLSAEDFRKIVKLGESASAPAADLELAEGEPSLRLHQTRERRPELVLAFKNSLSSFACVVCNFDFEEEYGAIGKGFIECHHTRPIGQMRPGERTRQSDLRAVCSNCHRMLHKGSPMLTIEQLRSMREG
jgi:HNH endonuclease